MTSADEFQPLSDFVFIWSVYQPECKCETGSTAIRAAGGLVVIDPIPLAAPAWAELLAFAPLHARQLREKHHVPVVTAPATRKDIDELKPDVVLLENELLYGIAAIPIPGATAGETAFHSREAGTVVVGDAMINLDVARGLEFLPDKYCTDAAANRVSLRKLLALDFHTVTFAHGTPLTTRAHEKLAALLA
jgi:glyoxylase-like metal-dependent hydrolase (beta-lactamase superfamily II)